MTRTDLLSQLAVLLGGRTAEEIALGEISTGAQNDLQRATDIARAMVTEFGMSDALGAINYDGNKRARFLDIPMPQERGLYGEDTAQKIDAEIKRILTDAHETGARRSSTDNREKLETVTRRLLEVEVMEGDELRQLLGHHADAPSPETMPLPADRTDGFARTERAAHLEPRRAEPSMAALTAIRGQSTTPGPSRRSRRPVGAAPSRTSARARSWRAGRRSPARRTPASRRRSRTAPAARRRGCRRRSRRSNTARPRGRDRRASPRRCSCSRSPATMNTPVADQRQAGDDRRKRRRRASAARRRRRCATPHARPARWPVRVDPPSRQRRHGRADQIHDEQPAERRGAQAVRRRRQVKRDVGEHRHLREQHAEADGVGGQQLAVAQQPQQRPAVPAGAWRGARARSRGSQIASAAAAARFTTARPTNAACQLRRGGHQAGQRAAAEAADHRAADVRGGGAPDVRRPATLVDVGDRDREDARRAAAPARTARRCNCRSVARRRRQRRRAPPAANAEPTMTRLRPTTSASRPTNGAAERHGHGRRGDRQADREMRGAEDVASAAAAAAGSRRGRGRR